tara:strand:- start:290 stop:538 length:249 start_codon:yes stop_codon:yes gene_type:complete
MTSKKPLHNLPLDEWFDDHWMPELGDPQHPYDDWPMATDPNENPRPEEEAADIHQEMYKIATAKYNPFSVGGSENIHDFDKN